VLIDVPAETMIYEFPQTQLAEKYIQDLRQAAAVRVCPIAGLSTREELHDVETCLEGDESRILIVSSEFHTRRALSIFRHYLPARRFSAAVARDEKQFGIRWWTHRQWAKTCLDEWLRLLWWEVVERWS
jgi:hypothetical protein